MVGRLARNEGICLGAPVDRQQDIRIEFNVTEYRRPGNEDGAPASGGRRVNGTLTRKFLDTRITFRQDSLNYILKTSSRRRRRFCEIGMARTAHSARQPAANYRSRERRDLFSATSSHGCEWRL